MHEGPTTRKAVSRESGNAVAFAALMVGNVALAFGPWFVRLTDVGPVAAAFWRISLATPVLLVLAAATGGRLLSSVRGLGWILIGSGVLFAGDLAAWHLGIHHTKLANATLFGNAATFVFPLYGFLVARAWPTRTQGLALALAAIGAALLMGRSYQLAPQNFIGDLLCLLAGLLYAGYFILMSRARQTMAPLPALGFSSAAAILPLLVSALVLGEKIMPANWTPLMSLALLSQVLGQGLMIYALGRLSPLVIGLALLTQPIVAALVGWLYYGETLGVADFVGAALVAIALVLVRIAPPRPLPLPPVSGA
ncbi:DMT family transporter [Sphingomonas olei]|jgi:drug/metabolite transporter (DMT)-like permease|uniref:DMT family transporter n=1 Tax=Sphingomonas olei TaxID=1886787 RepID=A0ABY2QIR2_9SPHN|nr:DMT family transporter [Sphingomonas olei]THG39387.1 DMT family transporter [Sphingomonas olei]